MNLGNFLKSAKKGINLKKTGQKVSRCWFCHQWVFFVLAMLVTGAAGVYYWYQLTYLSVWNEEKKMKYAASRSQDINFKEEAFKKVLEDVQKRKNSFETEINPTKDIFKPY